MMIKKQLFLLSLLSSLAGCSSTLQDYQGVEPKLELDQFFNGHLEAYGIVQNFNGKVSRRFRADILASWDENEGQLDELFYFNDGEKQHRCWKLVKSEDNYSGTAGDVIGEAKGEVVGNAMNWHYYLSIPVGEKTWKIKLDDWMYLVDENNLINRAGMYKFGLKVGEITLYIRKVSDTPHRAPTPNCAHIKER